MKFEWGHGHRLLIVDDMPAIRLLLREVARTAGFDVQESWNCTSAAAQLTTFRPHVVMLDIGLPDGDGMSLLDAIRAGHPSVRVIVVTAHDERDRVKDAMARGAASYIVKPFTPRHVLAELQRCLPRQAAHDVR